jgi:hypothetical protein
MTVIGPVSDTPLLRKEVGSIIHNNWHILQRVWANLGFQPCHYSVDRCSGVNGVLEAFRLTSTAWHALAFRQNQRTVTTPRWVTMVTTELLISFSGIKHPGDVFSTHYASTVTHCLLELN